MKLDIQPADRRLFLLAPPFSQRSSHDILGEKTAATLTDGGLSCETHDLWPDAIAALLHSGKIPFGRRIFALMIAPHAASRKLDRIQKGDTAWILGPAVPRQEFPHHEHSLKKRGARYIFHVCDDWLSIPNLREMTLQRCRLADLIVVPTQTLRKRIQAEVPNTKVVMLMEPIDVERVSPTPMAQTLYPPRLVWTGNPHNLHFIGTVTNALHTLSKSHDFILRVISEHPPRTEFPFRTEWLKYSYKSESAMLTGAIAGLSPLEDTPYNRAKGTYKPKTYMAAGIPVVCSNIGYQKELVDHGKSGLLCSSDNEWVGNLSALLSNPSLANRMGREARRVAVSRFSHDAVRDSWIQAVESIYTSSSRNRHNLRPTYSRK